MGSNVICYLSVYVDNPLGFQGLPAIIYLSDFCEFFSFGNNCKIRHENLLKMSQYGRICHILSFNKRAYSSHMWYYHIINGASQLGPDGAAIREKSPPATY